MQENKNYKQPQGDISKIMQSAISSISGVVENVKCQIHDKTEDYISKLDFVKQEEFEVLKSMLGEIRLQQEKLNKKIDEIENKLIEKKSK
jgi:BMFP domain-containing protein YqiC